jgi:hypothetical protein
LRGAAQQCAHARSRTPAVVRTRAGVTGDGELMLSGRRALRSRQAPGPHQSLNGVPCTHFVGSTAPHPPSGVGPSRHAAGTSMARTCGAGLPAGRGRPSSVVMTPTRVGRRRALQRRCADAPRCAGGRKRGSSGVLAGVLMSQRSIVALHRRRHFRGSSARHYAGGAA